MEEELGKPQEVELLNYGVVYNGDTFVALNGSLFEVVDGGLDKGTHLLFPPATQTITLKKKNVTN